MAGGKRRVMAALGVSANAEDLYRLLLANPGLSADEIGDRVPLGRHQVHRTLAELERIAMVTRRSGTPSRFQPAPPDIVIDALVSARAEELDQARLDGHGLMDLYHTPPDQVRATEVVEVLTSRDAVVERWGQMLSVTRTSLEVFNRPPFAQPQASTDEPLQASLLARGAVSRGLYDEEGVRTPGMLEHAQRMAALGEQVRLLSHLPLKLALFDRRVALVPLLQPEPGTGLDAGLVVHQSALLDALTTLFDVYWERGKPAWSHDRNDDDEVTRTIFDLLAAGLKDEAIARQLGLSAKTVRRRISAAQDRLGVTTRFQAGLTLGRQGWP